MAYKRIISSYKRSKDAYNTSWYIMGEHNPNEGKIKRLNDSAVKYSAILTAIADFIYTFTDDFSKSDITNYINSSKKKIQDIMIKDGISDDTINFYTEYLLILDKFSNITKKDYEKLLSFIESERKGIKEDNYDKRQKDIINEIVDMLIDIKRKTKPENVVFHVGTDINEVKKYINKNICIYSLILKAVTDGLACLNVNSIDKDSKQMHDIKNDGMYQDLNDSDFDTYRTTFNSVAVLTPNNKRRLRKKMKLNMLEKNQ